MAADSSAFSCLPLAVRDSILRQAFHQLDQKHLFGVAPRVCRLWRQLSISIITSLDAKTTTAEAAEQLSLWMQNHGTGLDTLNLQIDEPALCVLHALAAAQQLRSLTLTSTSMRGPQLNVTLHSLTSLTSLSINDFISTASLLDSILALTGLESLSLSGVQVNYDWQRVVPQFATTLIKLTSLDLHYVNEEMRPATLSHLCSLPDLKELAVRIIPSINLPLIKGLPITNARFTVYDERQLGHIEAWLEDASGCLRDLRIEAYTRPLNAHGLPLHRATQLKHLDMCEVQPDISQVAALTNLIDLTLRKCGLDDAAVCKLSSLRSLQTLDMSWNDGVVGAQESMEVLASSMPHLRELSLKVPSAQEAAERAFGHRVVALVKRCGFLHLKSLAEPDVPS